MKIATLVVRAAIGAAPVVYERPYILAWNLMIDGGIWFLEKLVIALRFLGL